MTKTPSVPALNFHDQKFDITSRDGQQWLRLPQIGAALGYTNQYHAQKLYQKHAAEFTDSMTAVVKLKTAGGMQEVRIFSLRGAHLLGMFARTERAAEFRRWVLDILDAQNAADAQRRAKLGANALTVQPAPQARADFDLRATMLADNSTPTIALPPEVQAALNRKAWALAGSAYDLLREFMARRVAYGSEVGQPRRINEARAKAIIAETTLDMALAPAHYNMLHGVLTTMEMVANVAHDSLAKMREELKQKGMVQ